MESLKIDAAENRTVIFPHTSKSFTDLLLYHCSFVMQFKYLTVVAALIAGANAIGDVCKHK